MLGAPTTGMFAMLAALATLAFLAGLWLAICAIARTLEESGSKIAAALQGRSPLARPAAVPMVSMRATQRARIARPVHARPRLRAAA